MDLFHPSFPSTLVYPVLCPRILVLFTRSLVSEKVSCCSLSLLYPSSRHLLCLLQDLPSEHSVFVDNGSQIRFSNRSKDYDLGRSLSHLRGPPFSQMTLTLKLDLIPDLFCLPLFVRRVIHFPILSYFSIFTPTFSYQTVTDTKLTFIIHVVLSPTHEFTDF